MSAPTRRVTDGPGLATRTGTRDGAYDRSDSYQKTDRLAAWLGASINQEQQLMDTNVLDFGDYPEIETDGIADVSIIRHTAWLRMFRWRKIDGIWRAVVCLAVSRPVEGLHDPLPHNRDLQAVPMTLELNGSNCSNLN